MYYKNKRKTYEDYRRERKLKDIKSKIDFVCPKCHEFIYSREFPGPYNQYVKSYNLPCKNCGYEIEYTIIDGFLKTYSIKSTFESEYREKIKKESRKCEVCGKSISDKPSYYTLCLSCWKKEKGYIKGYKKTSNNEEKKTGYNNSDKTSLREALDGDEYAYYNLYGEFPSGDDW